MQCLHFVIQQVVLSAQTELGTVLELGGGPGPRWTQWGNHQAGAHVLHKRCFGQKAALTSL